jgi:hypothetical protein
MWCDFLDKENSITRQGVVFEISAKDKSWTRYEDLIKFACFTPQLIREMLQLANLCILESFGDFHRSPLGKGPEQIYITTKC